MYVQYLRIAKAQTFLQSAGLAEMSLRS